MELSKITPDQVIYFEYGWFKINATLVFTWALMALICITAWLITRNLSAKARISRGQHLLELFVEFIRAQVEEVLSGQTRQLVPFIGTLFLFLVLANGLTIVPGYLPPTASLSTTAALAICVFAAVPLYGIMHAGVGGYLKHYIEPSPLMLPFHLIGELSRTLALAVRLFGNIMSGLKIVGILIAIAPLVFPVIMQAFGLLTGVIQAYIFAVLALVYISSGLEAHQQQATAAAGKDSKGDS